MTRIPVYKGSVVAFFALVDDDVAKELGTVRWFERDGYAIRRPTYGGRRVCEGMHRRILGIPSGDPLIVHHLNGRPLDNRRENLVVCASHSEHRRVYHGAAPLATHLKSNDPPALRLTARADGSSTKGV